MGSISPYLFFDGDCAGAFARYQEVFGGELQVMTHADLPGDAEPMPGAEPHHVMHAALSFGDAVIMGSDDPGALGSRGGIAVTFTAPDAVTAERAFDALSEDGEVTMPFEATFWSLGFGCAPTGSASPGWSTPKANRGSDAATARPAWRPVKRQPPRKVPSRER